ncbi:hypothetical protein LshimejAT787_0312280 [Lyophyllum shimeji]|uniref:Uncharacterized protein n=1 Tax=Lyophyllum shimeji TaxID=47721 RepID=A0A9P3UN35_LYOSH|nr:hypothetical protein LshimejAT787_0312280 [Lyophyllum shimeji]
MPATKQTAKKCTGAPAPRQELPTGKRKRSDDDNAANKRHTRSSHRKQGSSEDAPSAADHMETDAVMEVEERAVEDDRHNKYCSGCRNGGRLIGCNTCKRVLCDACVKFPAVLRDDEVFICPRCHIQPPAGKGPRNIAPYRAFSSSKTWTMLEGGPTTRESFALCNSPPLVIISMRLSSIPAVGDPAQVVYHNIAPFLGDNVVYIDLPWDLGDDNTAGDYEERVEDLATRLENGDLKRFRNFAVYVTDHSDPVRGDLHITVNDGGAAEVSSVLSQLFPPSLRAILKQGKLNTLTLLVCGAVMTVPDAYRDIKAFIDEGYFAWGMGFGQGHLQPCLMNPLLQAASVSWFIHERRWEAVLDDMQGVGAHSDLYLLLKGKPTVRYTWAHCSRKPFGEPSPYSCPGCKAVMPWGAPSKVVMASKAQAKSITLTCQSCKLERVYDRKESLERHSRGPLSFNEHGPVSERGDWYREVIV